MDPLPADLACGAFDAVPDAMIIVDNLDVIRQLVQLHGGSLRATSDGPGRGSEFIVLLPRSAAS